MNGDQRARWTRREVVGRSESHGCDSRVDCCIPSPSVLSIARKRWDREGMKGEKKKFTRLVAVVVRFECGCDCVCVSERLAKRGES
jgi:hypothetical protein